MDYRRSFRECFIEALYLCGLTTYSSGLRDFLLSDLACGSDPYQLAGEALHYFCTEEERWNGFQPGGPRGRAVSRVCDGSPSHKKNVIRPEVDSADRSCSLWGLVCLGAFGLSVGKPIGDCRIREPDLAELSVGVGRPTPLPALSSESYA